MIAAHTSDAWSTIVITLDDGGGAQAYTPGPSVSDAFAAANDFVDWVDGTFGSGTPASWLWSRDITTGGAIIAIVLGGGYTMTANAAAQSILGSAASGGPGLTATAWTSPAGTIAPPTPSASAIVDQRIKIMASTGMAAAAGVTRVGVGGLAAYSTRVRWPAYAVDMERLRAVQASMSSPRLITIYSSSYGWLQDLSAGPIVLAKAGKGLWRAVAEVRG